MIRRNSELSMGSMVKRNSDFSTASVEDRSVVLCVRRPKKKSEWEGHSIPGMSGDSAGPENEESGRAKRRFILAGPH